MKFEHISGLIAAPFTPMNTDGSINLDLIPDYYDLLKSNGVVGAFICGSTGEGVSLTQKEKKAVAKAWAECTKGDSEFKVMLFLGSTSINDCKELAQYALELGIYAISLTAPFYFKPANLEMLTQYCEEIAASVPTMPMYYYHIPVLTGVGFSMFEFLKKVDGKIPNFAGIKYTEEDFMDFQSCLTFKNNKYDMFWGRDENMLSALILGTKGFVGSTFNYAAPLYHHLIEAFTENKIKEAQNWQMTSINMIRLLGKYGGIATGKSYMKKLGLDCGEFRLPVKNMSNEQFVEFSNEVDSLGFEEYASKIPVLV